MNRTTGRRSAGHRPAGSPKAAVRLVSLGAVLLGAALTPSPAGAQTGVFTVNGGAATQTGQTYAATAQDQSAVYVLHAGYLTLTDCVLTKVGDASSVDQSSRYGINAGLLVASGGAVTLSGSSITTNASGANGLFATGTGSAITMAGGAIDASGGSAHGVDVTYGGVITLTGVDVTTHGLSSSALATDFGGGTVTVVGGAITAANTSTDSRSAGIYSTGTISVTGAVVSSLGDCGGVIDGANSIHLSDTDLTGALHGIKIWKTAPSGGGATVLLDGGSLTSGTGDAFHVTDATGHAASASITVTGGATIHAGSGHILQVLGTSTATFMIDGAALTGTLRADSPATAIVSLENSASLKGSASGIGLGIDASSTWEVTKNSVLTTLSDPAGISGLTITNIVGNGHDVHYDAGLAANSYLGGQVYTLVNGGTLTPAIVPVHEGTWGSVKARFRSR